MFCAPAEAVARRWPLEPRADRRADVLAEGNISKFYRKRRDKRERLGQSTNKIKKNDRYTASTSNIITRTIDLQLN